MEFEATARARLEKMLCTTDIDPTKLPLSLLEEITKKFADDQQIGSGGFATVYKGLLKNGTIAVKKLKNVVMDDTNFNTEVCNMVMVKHKNIVRFLGYCGDTQTEVLNYEGKNIIVEERQRLLCFEYLPEGNLRKHICDASEGLEWRVRYHIIKGICEGLDYLHQKKMVHSDLKPENILLDEYRVPKIADFGLAMFFDKNQSGFTSEKPLFGTLGYMAPEHIDGTIKFKSDIYSLGVIIIEILTGQKRCPDIKQVVENWKTRIETSQGDTTWLEQVRLCVEIGIKCTHYDAKERPDAKQIIEWLVEMERTIGFVENEIPTLTTQVRSLGLSESSKLLDIQPLELRFPLEQNKSIVECPVSLTNRTDHYVGVWITPTNHSSLPVLLEHKPLGGPVFQMIEPRSTLALGITMEKQRRLPTDIIRKRKQATKKVTLEVVMAVMGSKERLEMLKSFIDSMPHVNRYMLRIVDVVMVVMESTECLKKLKSYFSPRNWKTLLQTIEDKMVAIGSRERVDSLRLYVCRMLNMQGDEVLKRMELLGGRVHRETLTVVASHDDDPAASCQQAALIHDTDPKFISTFVFGEACGMDVHPTKTWILVGHHKKGLVSIWNYETQENVMVLHVTKANGECVSVRSAKFMAREQWFAAGDADGCVHVYAYATQAKVAEFEAHSGHPVSSLVVQPTDSFLLTSSTVTLASTKLWYWGQGWRCTREFDENSSGVSHLTFSPMNNNIFASVSMDGDVKVWDARKTHPVVTLQERSTGACSFYTDSDQHFLITTASRGDKSWGMIRNLKTLEVVHQLGVSNQWLLDAACHPNLPIVATLTSDKRIYLWDAKNYRVEKVVELTDDVPLRGLVFTGSDFARLMVPCRKGLSIVELDQFAALKTDLSSDRGN